MGAGFATGQEVIQYFISFGVWGLAGAPLAGILMVRRRCRDHQHRQLLHGRRAPGRVPPCSPP
ncbi:hypothetical protein QJS66_16850 [Kocuria rhizophila]|nr:hypothetical protein QJS66_16850 [Kocuria rhizophila]